MSEQPTMHLQLLGGFRLMTGDDEVNVPQTMRRLLAILALGGHMSRTRVVASLWPDREEARALAGLRTVVWRLHAQVDNPDRPMLRNTGSGLSLTNRLVVDLHELRQQLQAEPEAILPPVVRRLCASDAELLPGWDDEWLLAERERVHQMRLHALEQLTDVLARRGSYAAALDAALTCISIDPLRESAHRALIRTHFAEGNLSEALRAYEACRRVLDEQLGVEPTAETRALLDPAARS